MAPVLSCPLLAAGDYATRSSMDEAMYQLVGYAGRERPTRAAKPKGHRMPATTPAPAYGLARLGNGTAVHLTDASGILCNRWGTVNGVWRAPRVVTGTPADATCKRCRALLPPTPPADPAWTYAPENLTAARAAGFDV